MITAGKIFKSTGLMDDDNFKDTIVFITEHNENGVMAFVINKKADRALNELVEFNDSPAFPLFNGGPVDKEHLFFIHKHNGLIENGTHVINDMYLGGDFKQAVAYINNKLMTSADIKIFIGYCGWDNGEFETEIADGYWELMDEYDDIFFSN